MEEKQIYEIDLIQLCKALLRRWWLLILPAILSAAMAFGYTSYFVTPLYQSTAKMYINASPINGIDISGLTTARDLVETYAYLIKDTRLTLEEVAQKANVDYSYQQLRSMVTVKGGGNTEFLEITVTSPNPEEACLLANTIMEVVPSRAEVTNLNSTITSADWAVVASSPSSPDVSRKTVIGFLLGLIVGATLAVVLEVLNDKVQSEEWLTQSFGKDIPLLAIIPSAARAERREGRYGRYYRPYYSSYEKTNRKE